MGRAEPALRVSLRRVSTADAGRADLRLIGELPVSGEAVMRAEADFGRFFCSSIHVA